MLHTSTPAEIMRLWLRTGSMMAEAQLVIGMRMMGMAGLWRVSPAENSRMIAEKITAASESAFAASRAIMAGRSPALVAEHALRPIRRRTGANVRRLTRNGPGAG